MDGVIKEKMKKFELMINNADENLAKELIAVDASFYTPASDKPLYGPEGYLSIVNFMRKSFSDAQWKIDDIVANDNKAAVLWVLSATHDGEFLGKKPTGNKIKTTVANFYYFNNEGKITNDVAAQGMLGILRQAGIIDL